MPATRSQVRAKSAAQSTGDKTAAKTLKRSTKSDESKNEAPAVKRTRKKADLVVQDKDGKKKATKSEDVSSLNSDKLIDDKTEIQSHPNKKTSGRKAITKNSSKESATKQNKSVTQDRNSQAGNNLCKTNGIDSHNDGAATDRDKRHKEKSHSLLSIKTGNEDSAEPEIISGSSDSEFEEVPEAKIPVKCEKEAESRTTAMSDSSDSDFEEVPKPKIPMKREMKANTSKSANNTTSDGAKLKKGGKKPVKKEVKKPTTPKKHVSPKKEKVSLDDVSPMDLLLRLESEPGKEDATTSAKEVKVGKRKSVKKDPEEMSDSDSESDWENVADVNLEKELKDQVPDEAVEITLQEPSLFNKKRKRKEFVLEDWFQKQVNKYHRGTHLEMHKVHLLCLVSYGFQRNLMCSDDTLLALSLSHVPLRDLGQSVKKWDTTFLTKLTKWFSKYYSIDADTEVHGGDLMKALTSRLETTKVASEEELAYLFVLTIRSLGGEVRLVISLQPVSHKPNLKNFLIKRRKCEAEDKDSKDVETSDSLSSNTNSQADDAVPCSSKTSKKKGITASSKKVTTDKKKASTSESKGHQKDAGEAESETSKYWKKTTKCKTTKSAKEGSAKKSQTKTLKKEDTVSEKKERRRTAQRSNLGKKNYKETESDADDSDGEKFEPNLSESSSEDEQEETSLKGGKGKGKGKAKCKSSPASLNDVVELSSGSDFEELNTTFRSPPPRKQKPRNKKILSSESDDSVQFVKEKAKTKGTDYWAEVYLEKENKWMCVDCLKAEINKPHDLESRATKPVSYILAFDNGNHAKDVTRRYASSFTNTRKNRPDPEWWEETLEPYAGPVAEKDSYEDMQLQAELMQKPLPTAVGEYKSHPLYALKRHLLKYEAIYPDSAIPVGFIRGEAVYSRECIHLLHTRENWMKEARVVRIGETPYKLVKGRKKRRQALAGGDIEPMAELFGQWQTEDYIPPPAVDGKVPRNEYGNVELFKPSMLPGGTVHLKGLNGLNRIARKLNIDVAAAMVGWDHHCGFAHPVLDGWVVCEEHKDILMAAWDEEQEIIKEREAQKREKRIYGNWKLLIKGMLIREKLKSRFNLEPAKCSSQDSATPGASGGKAGDMEISWPLNRQNEKEKSKSKGKKKKQEGPLFPFEEI